MAYPAAQAWMLRRCAVDGSSSHGFVWPLSGPVEAPDWDPDPARDCGGGLHGLRRADGDWSLMKGERWQIVHYDPADGEVASFYKVRIRRGTVETVPLKDLWTRLRALRGDLHFGGSLNLSDCTGLTALPDGLRVGGSLDLRGCTGLTALPEGLRVGGGLYLRGCTGLTALPEGLSVGGSLDLSGCTGLTARYHVVRGRVQRASERAP